MSKKTLKGLFLDPLLRRIGEGIFWAISAVAPKQKRYIRQIFGKNNNMKRKKAKNSSRFDPNGSYTGVPQDGGKPTQDADDL